MASSEDCGGRDAHSHSVARRFRRQRAVDDAVGAASRPQSRSIPTERGVLDQYRGKSRRSFMLPRSVLPPFWTGGMVRGSGGAGLVLRPVEYGWFGLQRCRACAYAGYSAVFPLAPRILVTLFEDLVGRA